MPLKFVRKHDNTNDESTFNQYFTRESIGFMTLNSSYFKKIINFASGIVEQINMKLDRDGLRFSTMDGSHISLIDVFIPKNFFKGYNNGGEVISMGVELNILSKLMSHLSDDDELIFTLNKDKLDISFIHPRYKKFYAIKLLNIDYDELDIHELENPVVLQIESRHFNDVISHFNDIGETLEIQLRNKDDDMITFKSKGSMTELNIVLEPCDIIIQNLLNINAEFNIKNLQNFTKGYLINKNMEMKITENYPLKLSYTILDEGHVSYYIAPKISEDEDDDY